ncbi:ribosomal protein L7/L12 [Candidatus Synechococcus calcipolaris G9]|uniref:Ribosomal protein L7/L12 n=1 Tax=Candidatus Synechococcus calcipolaris G9 TaxID=1497997 RepID=A0ABT6F1U6_9SYNE|nr:ribosomal protein L7/L12 [Candidatus Synechococcus calcipolaris]MDG2991833.1 ribosomal protein L7/L12 [Candidatus Synechococcus calcipolaris G9]
MNNQGDTLPIAAMMAAEKGNLIEAIKITRLKTGLGLKEAKDAVETYLKNNPPQGKSF